MRRFAYSTGNAHLWRYFPVGIGLAFVFVILARGGHQPFSVFWFSFVVALVVFSVVLELVIRSRSPRTIEIDGNDLNLEWSDEALSVSMEDVSVRKGLDWLITSGRVLTARGRTFVVFRNLDDYDEFCTAVRIKAEPRTSES